MSFPVFPTPIAFGALVDSACVMSFPAQGCAASSGACAYYDPDKFRLLLHVAGTCVKLASPLFLLGSWAAARGRHLSGDGSDAGGDTSDGIQVKDASRAETKAPIAIDIPASPHRGHASRMRLVELGRRRPDSDYCTDSNEQIDWTMVPSQ